MKYKVEFIKGGKSMNYHDHKDYHDHDKQIGYHHDYHKCKKHGQDFHDDCHEFHEHRHYHRDYDHCPKCKKPRHHHQHDCDCKKHDHKHHHHHDCDCKNFDHHDHFETCKHPVIFDRRFVVKECDFHHHDSFDFHDDFCLNNHFICDDRFRFRLAGLEGGMAFRLRQLIDCDVKIELECGENEEEMLQGRICFVGADFVEIDVMKKEKKKKKVKRNRLMQKRVIKKKKTCKENKDEFRILPFESIKSVSIMEKKDDCC